MELLSLPDARLSLEFAEGELSLVMLALQRVARRLPRPARVLSKQAATYQELRVGGVRFILMTEDGDPALLSTSAKGDAVLRDVMIMVNAGQPLRAGETRHRNKAPGREYVY